MTIDEILKIAIEMDASDIHLKAGNPPLFRVHGRSTPLTAQAHGQDTENSAHQMMKEHHRARLEEDLDVDLAYSLPGFGRFRGSIYRQRSSIAIALRIIPFEVKTVRAAPPAPRPRENRRPRARAHPRHGIDRKRQDDDPGGDDRLHQHRSPRKTSSPSKTRSNTFTGTRRASSASARSAGTSRVSRGACAPRCARTRISSWWAKCATSTPSKRPSWPPRPATSSSARSIRSTRPRPSTGSSRSSRRTNTARSGSSSPASWPSSRCGCSRGGRQGPRPGRRGHGRHALHPGVHPGPGKDVPHPGRHRRRRFPIRDADVRPVDLSSLPRGLDLLRTGMRYSTSPDNFKLRVQGIQSTLDIALEEMEKEMGKVDREKAAEPRKRPDDNHEIRRTFLDYFSRRRAIGSSRARRSFPRTTRPSSSPTPG